MPSQSIIYASAVSAAGTRLVQGVTGTAVALALAVPAQAQTRPSISMEEIVVTAQKREQSLQEVPLAVTAFSGQELEEAAIVDLEEVARRTPGLQINTFAGGQPEIAIRGIGTKEDGPGASDSTLVAVDGVYIAARHAAVTDIFDLERIEVLRGPQGSNFGKNSIGGVINFVTRKPDEEVRVKVRQRVGEFGRFDTQGLVSGPVMDNLYAKFSFSRRHHDGYIRNILPVDFGETGSINAGEIANRGEQQGERNSFSWRFQARWIPTPDIEVLLSIDGTDDDNGATNREPIGSQTITFPHGGGTASDPVAVNAALGGAGDPHTSLAESEGFEDREIRGYTLRVDWTLPFGDLTSLTAYRESEYDWLEDSEGLPPTPPISLAPPTDQDLARLFGPPSSGFAFDVNDFAEEEAEQFTQELRITSRQDQAFRWLGGVFLSWEDLSRTETFAFTALSDSSRVPSEAASIQNNKTSSYAAFTTLEYDVMENLTLTLGGRFSWERKEITAENEVFTSPGFLPLLQPFDQVSNSEIWRNVTGRFSISYFPTESVQLYATASSGFKSGGFTGSASTAEIATEAFDPEEAFNYEGGVKGTFLDQRLRLALTGFYIDYNDLQVTRFFQPADADFGQFITENAGQAEIKGVEAEFVGQPLPGVEIGGSYAYLDATFEEFTGTPSFGQTGDFSGNRLRQAPRHTANAYVRYERSLGDMGLVFARGDFRYQSLSFFDPDNNPITVSPEHQIYDGRIGWQSNDGRWGAQFWVENIGDEDYVTHAFSQRGGQIAFGLFGPPRRFGATVEFNY